MAQEFMLKVTLEANGSGAVIKNVRQVSAALDEVGRAHSRAGKEADTHYHKQGKGVIGTANSTKSFSKLAQSINGDNNSLVGAYAALAANIFTVTAAFGALKKAAEVEQVVSGLVASGARLGLTYKNTIQEVKDLSDGLLSLEQSARSTAQVMAAGFNSDALKRITLVAKDASFALGRDMTESMDRLTRGVIKLEPELLDELGIMVRIDEATQAYARSLGKSASSLTAVEKRQGFLNAVLAEGGAKFGGIADAAGGAGGLTKLAATFADLTHEVFKFLNIAAVPLAAVFSTSKVALLGGMLLFAASIKGQLVPALTDAADSMQKVAEKSSKLSGITASNIITNARGAAAKGQDKAVNDYFIAVQKGEGSLEKTTQYQEKLNKAIDENSAKTSKNAKEKIVAYRMQLNGLSQIEASQLQTASITNQANAANAASMGNYRSAVRFTAASIQDYAAHVAVANTKTGILGKVSRGTSIGMFTLAASAKTAGVAFLTFLPYLGLIVMALGFVTAAVGAMYKAFVGADVVAARKELKEIVKGLEDKRQAILSVASTTASAASKELQLNIAVSNSINEQADAVKKLADAKKRFNEESNSDTKNLLITESQRNQQDIKNISSMEVRYSGISDIIAENYYSPIEEVREATRQTIKEFGGLKKTLSSVENASEVLQVTKQRLGGLGITAQAAADSWKELDKSVADFIKSATPSTPYDGLQKSLLNNAKALIEYRIEANKTGESAEKFGKILAGIGPEAEQLISQKSVKALKDYRDALAQRDSIKSTDPEAAANFAKIVLPSYRAAALLAEEELVTRSKIVSELQNEQLLMGSLIQLASAKAAQLNGFEIRAAGQIKARMQAENAVLGLQSKQALAQVELLSIMLKSKQENLKLLVEELKLTSSITGQISAQAVYNELITAQRSLSTIEQNPFVTTPAAKAAAEERVKKALQLVETYEALKRGQAAIDAARISSAAIGLGRTTEAQQNAADAAGIKKLDADIAARAESLLKVKQDEAKARKSILDIVSGTSVITQEAVNQEESRLFKAAELAKKTALANRDAAKAAEESNLADMTAKGMASEAAKNKTAEILQLIQDEYDARVRIIDSETDLAILTYAKVQNLEEVKSATNDIISMQRDLLSIELRLKSTADARVKALLDATRTAQGIQITPAQQRNEEIASATKKVQAAKEQAEIQYAIIDAETELLKEKMSIARQEAFIALTVLKQQKEQNPALIAAYERLIGLQDRALGQSSDGLVQTGTGTIDRQRAAKRSEAGEDVKNAENDLTIAKLDKTLSQFMIDMNNLKNVSTEIGEIWAGDGSLGSKIASSILEAEGPLNKMKEQFKALGPQGEIMASMIEGFQGIAASFTDMVAVFDTQGATLADKFIAIGGVINSVLSTISSVSESSSKARISAVDQEIAAEQKRDGKSSESLARIQALEKKKDAIAKKAFEVNKKIQMAQAIINTATAITSALAYGGPAGPFIAAAYAAMGAAQLAIIAGTQYQSSSSAASVATPSAVSVGKRSDSVNLARNNSTPGGELGYLTGAQGTGTNATNFRPRAYGGYGHAGMIVGEKGPEVFTPSVPGQITPNDKVSGQQAAPVNFHINAIDAEGVEQVLTNQRGHIIGMLREAANANGERFLENVDTAKYARRGGRRL